MHFRIAVLSLLIACLSCFGTTTVFAQTLKVLSTDELQDLILKNQSKIESVYFDYRGTDAYVGNDQFPRGTYLRRIVAAKAPNLFSHETAHGSDHLAWEKDPRRRHCIVENDQVFDNWVTNRAYNKILWAPDAPLPGSMPGEPIILATGIWPMVDRKAPEREGNPLVLRDVAESDRFSVRPNLENVSTHWCHVLENPGIDALWIDVDQGCALLARNFYDLKTGELYLRHELDGHKEVKPGTWLPSTVRTIKYDYLADDANKKIQVLSDLTLQISVARVNDVPDSMFVFSSKRGALWLNPPKEESLSAIQTHSGGTDHLDNLVTWAKPILSDQPPVEPSIPWLSWILAGLAGLGTFLVLEVIFQPHIASTLPTEVPGCSGDNS